MIIAKQDQIHQSLGYQCTKLNPFFINLFFFKIQLFLSLELGKTGF